MPSSPTPHPSSAIFPMHVLGSGSIGLLYASAIHSHLSCDHRQESHASDKKLNNISHPVTLLMRSHHKPHLIERAGASDQSPHWLAPVSVSRKLNGEDSNTTLRHCDIPVEIIEDETNKSGDERSPIKCLLLCTKANDAIPALNSIWGRFSSFSLPSSPAQVIILSNGALAIRDAIYKQFSQNEIPGNQTLVGGARIILGTTTHGAYRTQCANNDNVRQYSVIHAGEGSTHCANKEFISLCQSIGWESSALSDFEMNVMLWKKLAVNCVINPLTAIHGVKNGQLLGLKHMGKDIHVIARQILEEVSIVATKEMKSLFNETRANEAGNSVKNEALLESVKDELSVTSLEEFVFKVMHDTKDNMSSMLQDVKAKRITEVQFLNGYVSSVGQQKYGLECPVNMEMCRLVEELESR